MDLVEIRKKAKSRKNKGAGKDSGTRGKKEAKVPEQESVTSPVDESVSPVGNEAVKGSAGVKTNAKEKGKEKEKEKEKESSSPLEGHEADGLPEEEMINDSLSSLRSVLMSQQEEEEEVEEEKLQLLTFMLGQEEYALNIMDIKEIIRPKEVTEVPKASDYILGILSLRGTIIPILDVNKRLGLAIQESGQQNRIVVVKWQEHLFGLLVDSVVQVMNIPLDKIEPPPEILGGVEGEYLGGVGKIDDRLIILLNLGKVLALEEVEMSEQLRLPPESGG